MLYEIEHTNDYIELLMNAEILCASKPRHFT